MNYRSFFLYATSALGIVVATPPEAGEAGNQQREAPAAESIVPGKAAKPKTIEAQVPLPASWELSATLPGAAGPSAPFEYFSGDRDLHDTHMKWDGKSWTITTKDLRTGTIERFTQSGTGELGRVEVFQGKPERPPNGVSLEDFASGLKRNHDWHGVEDVGPPLRVSAGLVPLPRSMRESFVGLDIAFGQPMGYAMDNLLPDSVRDEMMAERRAFVDKLNREDARRAGQSKPQPS